MLLCQNRETHLLPLPTNAVTSTPSRSHLSKLPVYVIYYLMEFAHWDWFTEEVEEGEEEEEDEEGGRRYGSLTRSGKIDCTLYVCYIIKIRPAERLC